MVQLLLHREDVLVELVLRFDDDLLGLFQLPRSLDQLGLIAM